MPALNTGTGNNEKTTKLTIPEVRTDTKIAGDFSSEQPYFNFFYINMITSHGYQTMSDDGKLDSDLKIVRDIMTDPFGGGGSTGGTPPPAPVPSGHFTPEDDFDLGPMHMQCLGDEMQGYNSYPPPHMMHQQQQAMYQQHHHHQMGMQQHWSQQQGYMNGGYYEQYNNYGYGQQMYQQHPQIQQHSQQAHGMVPGGGPSPGGSHNTPSPQALSESDGDEHTIRNNNILKRPSPNGDNVYSGHQQLLQQQQQQQQVGLGHHGHMGPPHHHHPHGIPPHVHPGHHHHPHVHPHHHMITGHPSAGLMSSGPPMPKKPKVSKRKKKRDPNEPQKPVSAYALFFRDSQASIKAANPNAAFGDVSKIVASMWDGLDPDSKAAYKKRTENAKKDYLKKLAAYRASLVSKGSGPGDGNIGYGGTFAGFSTFGSESNLIHHGHHPKPFMTTPGGTGSIPPVGGVTSATGSPGSGPGYPVPPRPPGQPGPTSHPSQMSAHLGHPQMHSQQQQQQQQQQHHPGSNYMNMHGQVNLIMPLSDISTTI